MLRIYKLTDGFATDLQYLRDGAKVPDGFLSEPHDETPFTPESKSTPAGWQKRQAIESDLKEQNGLRSEAMEYFMRGESMPADKVQSIKTIDARLKAKNG